MLHQPEYIEQLHMLPPHMGGAIKRYIENGIAPGSFLTAVLCNDLREEFARADDENSRAMRSWVQYLYSYAPGGCWGSKERFEAWIACGGLNAADVDVAA